MTRLSLFPDGTTIENDSLTIAEHNLAALADTYGTPLYLYDRATMDSAVDAYRRCLAAQYPGPASVTYAGKAYLCTAIARWTQEHSLWLDCTGEAEIAIALAGGVPRQRILVHGVNKSPADVESAIRHAGTIVVDNQSELVRLSRHIPASASRFPGIWLRLQPGLAVGAHAYTQTGQRGSKFGLDREDLIAAALNCRRYSLPLEGLHFHLGSQFRDPSPLKPAIRLALELAAQIGFEGDWHFSPGGGWGVAYHEGELPHPDLERYVSLIVESVLQGCRAHGLSLPHLHLEPGRSLLARAGVAVYRVLTVKRLGDRTWLLVDGGLADNPRPALYAAKYTCLPVARPDREPGGRVYVAGPYCETGDVLIEDISMPEIAEGELIAVPVSGAYQLSMASNYNGARRPAVLWLEPDQARLIQRRETVTDLLQRDTE